MEQRIPKELRPRHQCCNAYVEIITRTESRQASWYACLGFVCQFAKLAAMTVCEWPNLISVGSNKSLVPSTKLELGYAAAFQRSAGLWVNYTRWQFHPASGME